jgi:hypothetical protein
VEQSQGRDEDSEMLLRDGEDDQSGVILITRLYQNIPMGIEGFSILFRFASSFE